MGFPKLRVEVVVKDEEKVEFVSRMLRQELDFPNFYVMVNVSTDSLLSRNLGEKLHDRDLGENRHVCVKDWNYEELRSNRVAFVEEVHSKVDYVLRNYRQD